jgi:tripartite-type tricarboxylate transporter receptor subunit TctC
MMLHCFASSALFALLALGVPALAGAADDSWPSRPLKLVVPVAAGGGIDLMARVLADRLGQQLPQRVLIENVGGPGAIGARLVAKADPDGYTFLFPGPGHAAIPFLQKPAPYDPIDDFAPVSLVTQFPLVVVINPRLPARTLPDFIALAKASPGKYTFGSSGIGGSSHIPVELLKHLAGIDLVHVPFRGGSQSSAALVAGQIDLIIDGLAPQLGNIAEGRVRVLGVTTRKRTAFLPDVPAVAELLPGYEFPMWVAVFAPGRTPAPIIERLSNEIATALKDPTVHKRYLDLKVDPVGSTPPELDRFFRAQLEFNAGIIRRANIAVTE